MQQPKSFVSMPGEHVHGPDKFLNHVKEIITSGINETIPAKESCFIRLMSFNIHLFLDAKNIANHESIYADVQAVNPDVVVFQESPDTLTRDRYLPVDERMASMGFEHILRCNGEEYAELGNVLYSKLPLSGIISQKFRQNDRCFVSGIVEFKGKQLRITGTHLAVSQASHRLDQMTQLVSFHQSLMKSSHIIMADFNAWFSSKELQYARHFGFMDSFDAKGWERPNFTCWTGTSIDFILICPKVQLEWEISGSYVYYTVSSDHLPIIIDMKPWEK